MDIYVCGTQVPYTRGGAELLFTNLVAALEAEGHQVEPVRLPISWRREELLDTALAWRFLPVQADLVIALNFPSYFVRHPRKVVWLVHQHRPAYELAGTEWSNFGDDDASLELQRQLVEWDSVALGEAERRYTISGVVSDRLTRFNGLSSTPLYHPPPLAGELHEGPFGREVVCVMRLVQHKRPDLFVEAIGLTGGDAHGVLVGDGPMGPALAERTAELARRGQAPPVELTGFLEDAALVKRLGSARAVMYAPFDEDYGYVTLQAFLAGKPVVTTTDAGGVLEWVEDDVTGLVVEPDPAAVARALDRLAGDAALAARLGANGRERARRLTWSHVVDTLVGPPMIGRSRT